MSNVANYIIDSKQGEKEKSNLMRRPTVANLKNYHMKTKGQGELINLEKQFLEKFSNMSEFYHMISNVKHFIDFRCGQ